MGFTDMLLHHKIKSGGKTFTTIPEGNWLRDLLTSPDRTLSITRKIFPTKVLLKYNPAEFRVFYIYFHLK